jgi:hypothetical protein
MFIFTAISLGDNMGSRGHVVSTVFARVICALFFSVLAAEKSGCVKCADFFFFLWRS